MTVEQLTTARQLLETGLTYKEVAARMGVSRQTVSKWAQIAGFKKIRTVYSTAAPLEYRRELLRAVLDELAIYNTLKDNNLPPLSRCMGWWEVCNEICHILLEFPPVGVELPARLRMPFPLSKAEKAAYMVDSIKATAAGVMLYKCDPAPRNESFILLHSMAVTALSYLE